MAIAAVPAYLGNDFAGASPGMRFGIYLKLWGTNNRTGWRLWATHDINYRVKGKDKVEVACKDENKTAALREATRLTRQDQELMNALLARQTALANPLRQAGQMLRVDAQAIAPFTTGLGNEHPLENGFTFLNPYGLPYLPGSGVKGVLRQAARELASGDWGDTQGWDLAERYSLTLADRTRISLSLLDVLFGKQSQDHETEHVRGALCFWDVYPQLPGQSLTVEVMTAHQTHYLQARPQDPTSPHESGQPNPINFLTVPPGADFHFHIQCDQPFLARTAPELAAPQVWQPLLNAALEHAFEWLGFGAKTAVGYGAMKRDRRAELARQQAEQAAAEQRAQEQAERQRAQEQAARAEAERQAFEALPESEKALRQFNQGLSSLGEPPLTKDTYANFSGLINALAELAQRWPDANERQQVADALTAASDRFGWHAPGLKPDKRKKQEDKRMKLLRAVIDGQT